MCTRSVRVLFSNKYLLSISNKKQVSNKFKYFWCKYKYLVKNWTCFKHFEPFGSISNLSAKNKTFYDLKMFVHFIHIELLLYSHPLILRVYWSFLEFSWSFLWIFYALTRWFHFLFEKCQFLGENLIFISLLNHYPQFRSTTGFLLELLLGSTRIQQMVPLREGVKNTQRGGGSFKFAATGCGCKTLTPPKNS